ncbi:putative steroid sulfotransferase [Helianthus annuus]|nr:putative steroid sulfotransferase [Helianthus annuus]
MSLNNASSLSFATVPSENDHEHNKADLDLTLDRYTDMLTTCPKDKGWLSENLYMYKGFWHFNFSYGVFSLEAMMSMQDTFKAQPTDIYLITLPKSGTTWIKALAYAIVNRERYKSNTLSSHPLLTYNPHKCVPFLETEVFGKTSVYVDGCLPRLFATHIPYSSLPQSILDSGCRIVYMCRNPKDVLVSLFHFTNKLRDKSRCRMAFDEAFEMFSKGVMPYGPYWDHVKAYYNFNLEHPNNILFLTYEDMKENTVNKVKLLAEFLGCAFTKEEEARGVVDEIVRLCSFKKLSEVNKHGDFSEGVPNDAFFREGKVGGWRSHLSNEMTKVLNQITTEKFHGLDISFEVGSLVRN